MVELIDIKIPKHLLEAFHDFIVVSITSLGDISDRKDWAKDEREIVEWLEHGERKIKKFSAQIDLYGKTFIRKSLVLILYLTQKIHLTRSGD